MNDDVTFVFTSCFSRPDPQCPIHVTYRMAELPMQILVAGLDYGRHKGWDCVLCTCVLNVPGDSGEPRSLRVLSVSELYCVFLWDAAEWGVQKLHG